MPKYHNIHLQAPLCSLQLGFALWIDKPYVLDVKQRAGEGLVYFSHHSLIIPLSGIGVAKKKKKA